MTRRVDPVAVGRILESAFLVRSSKLSGLASDGKITCSPSLPSSCNQSAFRGVDPAVQSAQTYLRDSILDAAEIEASAPLVPSALSVSTRSPLTNKNDFSAATERAWRPRKEIGTTLEGRDLRLLDLSGVRVSASFNRSDLFNAALVGSYFASCTFNSCNLRNADLAGGQFHSCTFMAADARGANARHTHFSHCTFHRADLCDWDATSATFFQCSFTMSDLSRWKVDAQTAVIKPADWGRCRRLGWRLKAGSGLREFRAVGDPNSPHALSLQPPCRSACCPAPNEH